jgi:type II secretory pathway component GspD/PulD (secretin)
MIPLITSIVIVLATPILAFSQENPILAFSQENAPPPTPSDAGSLRVSMNGDKIVVETTSDNGARLLDLVEACESITGHRFVLGSRGIDELYVRLSQRHEVPKTRFFGFFQDCLRVLDLVLVSLPSTATDSPAASYSIVPSSGGSGNRPGSVRASAQTIDLAQLPAHAFDSAIVYTVSVPLRYVNAQELMNTLSSYLTDPMTESVRAVASSNSIVMSSFGSNLATIAAMIERLDIPSAGVSPTVEVFPLKHVVASEIVRQVESHFVPQNPARVSNLPFTSVPSITADDRTNSIIVSGTPSEIASAKTLITALDVAANDTIVSQVFVLPGGDGQELAMTLRELYGSREKSEDGKNTEHAADSPIQFVATANGDKLIARGPASRMKEVADLIAKLAAAK